VIGRQSPFGGDSPEFKTSQPSVLNRFTLHGVLTKSVPQTLRRLAVFREEPVPERKAGRQCPEPAPAAPCAGRALVNRARCGGLGLSASIPGAINADPAVSWCFAVRQPAHAGRASISDQP
jgi:hypothetical protein